VFTRLEIVTAKPRVQLRPKLRYVVAPDCRTDKTLPSTTVNRPIPVKISPGLSAFFMAAGSAQMPLFVSLAAVSAAIRLEAQSLGPPEPMCGCLFPYRPRPVDAGEDDLAAILEAKAACIDHSRDAALTLRFEGASGRDRGTGCRRRKHEAQRQRRCDKRPAPPCRFYCRVHAQLCLQSNSCMLTIRREAHYPKLSCRRRGGVDGSQRHRSYFSDRIEFRPLP
jgi:hypothetical protein